MSTTIQNLEKDWNDNFMLYASSAIIVSTCIGGISAMSILQHGTGTSQLIQLILTVVLCNSVLASILTVQKPKIVFYAIIASVTICSVIALSNFLF